MKKSLCFCAMKMPGDKTLKKNDNDDDLFLWYG